MFREKPPIELVEQIIKNLGLSGLSDIRWFTKEELLLDTLDEWLPLLQAYYLPCKAERYLGGTMTNSRIITILRHCLKCHRIELKVQEKTLNGKKTTVYQIYSFQPNITLSFE